MWARFTVLNETPIASALAQQYHLNALPLSLGHFPMQRRLQLANLALRAFDHPSPPKQMARWNHKISLPSGTKLPQTPRFKQLWKRYYAGYEGGPEESGGDKRSIIITGG